MAGNGQFTPGPILHYVVFPQVAVAQGFFLGTHVTAPKQRGEYYEIPVFNDLGGRSARFQSIADGEEWKVFTTLNRFDYNIVRSIRYLKSGNIPNGSPALPNPIAFPLTGLSPALGSSLQTGRGTVVMGVQDFQLILINAFGFPTSNLASGLPTTAGLDLNTARGYSSCSLMAYEEDTESTRVLEVSMAIECRGLFNPSVNSATYGGYPSIPPRGFGNYWEGGIPGIININAVN